MIDADRIRHRLRYREAQCLARPARDDLRDLLADAAAALDALLAEREEVVRVLREMYAQQYETDEAGEAEGAMWYSQDELEAAIGATLFEHPELSS